MIRVIIARGEIGKTKKEIDLEGVLSIGSSSRVAVYLPGQKGGEKEQSSLS